MSRRRRATSLTCWAVSGGVLVAAVVINQSAVHWRSNVVDDHLFAYFGWCVSQGARPYLDVWDNKPPGIWWLNAAAIRVCGPGGGGELLLGTVAILTALAAFTGIARQAFHRSLLWPGALVGAVLLTNLAFECGGNRTETHVIACEAVAVWAYLRWLRHGRYALLFVAGLAAGAAPLFKQSGLAAAGACALHLMWWQWRAGGAARTAHGQRRGGQRRQAGFAALHSPYRWKPWLVAGGGLLLPPLAAGVVLASQGALGEAAFAVGRFNRAYFAVHDATWLRLDRALKVSDSVLWRLNAVYVVAAIGAAAGLCARVMRRSGPRTAGEPPPGIGGSSVGYVEHSAVGWVERSEAHLPRPGVGLFLVWFLLAGYLACVGPGRRGHHFMPMLPPLGLLFIYVLHLMAARRGLRAALTARPSVVCALVAWLHVLCVLVIANLNTAAHCWQTKPTWYSRGRSRPAACEAQAEEIVRLTAPTDTIYVWGWSPGTYRYAYRRPASRFATFEKLGQVGPHARFIIEGAVADIRRRPPQVFVISLGDYAAMTPPLDDFAAWLNRSYTLAVTIQGMHLLTRLDTAGARR